MSHPGNWSERKIALERSRAAEQARMEAQARQQIIHIWGDAYNFLALHPCATQRMGLEPKVVCAGCRREHEVGFDALLRSRFGHAPWSEIMPHLRCSVCRSPPSDLVFYAKNAARLNQAEVGRLSIQAPNAAA